MAFPLWAVSDFDISTVARSFPSGLSLAMTYGESMKLWGEQSPWYGYLRLSATPQTSGVVHSFKGQVDFFPLSFIGVYAGHTETKRHYEDFQGLDCTLYRCSGRLNRKFVGAKLGLSLGSVLVLGQATIERVQMSSDGQIFVDEQATLLARADNEQRRNLSVVLAIKMDDTQKWGLLYVNDSMKYYRNQSSMGLLFWQVQQVESEGFSYLLGTGYFYTKDRQLIGTVMGTVQWTLQKGLLLL